MPPLMCDPWRNIEIDVIQPQTDSDKSSVALETSVVGAIGMGAPRSQTGVGGD